MNHLDVGFTNTIASVMNIYWHKYWQEAVNTAKAVNKPGKPPLFKYTSHSYLLDLFFNCPKAMGLHCNEPDADDDIDIGVTPDYHSHCVVCPNASEVALVKDAIKAGTITWHAFPMNCEPEIADASLFESGIASVHALDDIFDVGDLD